MRACVRSRLAVVTGCVVLAVWLATSAEQPVSAQDSDKLLAEVRTAWENREAATKTIRMSWTLKTFTPKGGRNLMLPMHMTKDGKARPPADVTHDGKATLLLDGMKARYSQEDMVWSEGDFAFIPNRLDSGFADGKSKALRYHGTQKWPDGIIAKSKWNSYCNELPTWAPCIAVRGTSSQVMSGEGLDAFTVARRTVVDGKNVVELTQPRTETRGEIKIWVAPQQEYSAVRYEGYHPKNGEVVLRMIATPQRHHSGVWLPGTWVCSSFRDKKLAYTTTATMTDVEVGLNVTDDDFQVAFPAGTEVEDRSGDKRVNYILKDDGNKRIILPSESSATYEDLLRTETGELAPGGRPSWFARNWWVCVAGSVVLVLLALLLYRATRAPASGGSMTS
ncbi:MAG: hypothetical protein L0241_11125 [Planctomycetia bacterium]|nr:hypothetical protein [Planctomycetia bacterium]